MRHNFLVKANDLKNQSLQQDHLSRFRNCPAQKTTVQCLTLFAVKKILVLESHSPGPGFSFSSVVCATVSSILDCFSSPVVFSFLLIDCHLAIMLVRSGKTCQGVYKEKISVLTGLLFFFFSHNTKLTLLSVSLYCCTNSPIKSDVYPCKLCLSDFSMSCSMF